MSHKIKHGHITLQPLPTTLKIGHRRTHSFSLGGENTHAPEGRHLSFEAPPQFDTVLEYVSTLVCVS